jgi:glycosyltransferase involved in cell wall biosynthesis
MEPERGPTPLDGLSIVTVIKPGPGDPPTGAVARASLLFCTALGDLGARVRLLSLTGEGGRQYEVWGVPVYEFGLGGESHRLDTTRELASALELLSPDWVHAHCYEPMIHCCRARARNPFLRLMVTLHDSRLRWSRRLHMLPHRTRPDYVTGPSSGMLDASARWYGFSRSRMAVLPNPAAEAFLEPADPDPSLRVALGIEGAYPVLIWPARLHRQKGHADLLRAFAGVLRDHPSACLLLPGAGRHEAVVRAVADRLGVAHRVRFLGLRSDVRELLALSDMVVCPSHMEALCTSVIEGMAAGKPIVSTRVWGTEHVSDGETGLLVPIGSPHDLQAAILRLAGDRALAARMGEAGRDYAARVFPLSAFRERIAEVYAEAIRATGV